MGFKDFFKKKVEIFVTDKKLKAYQKAIELNPDDDVTWHNIGYVLDDLGRKEEALKAYQKTIELKPDNNVTWNNIGKVLDDLGRKEEALKAYQKAIELKPNDQRAWFNTGNVFDDLGKYEDAIKCYKKLRELDPEAKNVEEKLQDAKRKYIESSLKTLKLEIEDAKKYIFIPQEISEIAEKGVSQNFDYARDSLKKLLSEAKPVLSVELDKTSLNLNEWYRSRIKIENFCMDTFQHL
ncbi:MAG: tetratricopeptide repeat protein [Methanosarcina sp.]|nr:tetratricopeptide repeat protein [Methanosarcina sp.]MDD3873258.1 tetratricopeptide repeat protein [Methanosarcina sp.]MDD4522964.1 tetratricopeptide repeat protein [Methanosarcina sp.]HHV23746.1 tetratricopeptide repeat protein [Methanosarcina sp.]